MTSKSSLGYEIRSKNAGPFWLTIDIFCEDTRTFLRLCKEPQLSATALAKLLRSTADGIKIFQIEALNVIKISVPRPTIQGAIDDRDMHGAQLAYVLQHALTEEMKSD